MKIAVSISRILVGTLFIFSGLVKAIDPLGLAYKMQEFFEARAGSGNLFDFVMMIVEGVCGGCVLVV